MEVYRISQIIAELKRIQIEEGDLVVVVADPEKAQRPTWPVVSKDKRNSTIVLFN